MNQTNMEMNDNAVCQIMEDVIQSYIKKQDSMSDEQWLHSTLKNYFPDKTTEEVHGISQDFLNEMEQINKLWGNILASEKKGYNAQVWLFHQIHRCMKDNLNHSFCQRLMLQNATMEKLNKQIAQEITELNVGPTQNIHRKKNGKDDEMDSVFFHGAFIQKIRHKIIAEYEALLQMGVNPLHLKQQDLNDLAYHFSKNATAIGITTMVFMAELCLAKKLQQHGINEEKRKLVAKAIGTGADAGIRYAVAVVLRVSSERGLIPLLTKGTPATVFAGIAFIAIESSKIFLRYTKGELTGWEVFHQTSKISATGICSAILEANGYAIGASLGTAVFPGVGSMVGGFVGGFICDSVGKKATPYFYNRVTRMESVLSNILLANSHVNNHKNRTILVDELSLVKKEIYRGLYI